jgi:hypothetical protein
MDIVTAYKGIEYNHSDYTTEEQLATLPDVVRAIIEKSTETPTEGQ